MNVWILLVCASVLGSDQGNQPSTTERLLKNAVKVGGVCVVVGTCGYYLLNSSQPQNGESALLCSQNAQSSNSAVAINAVSCCALALQNVVSKVATGISKKWKDLLADKTDEFGNPTVFMDCSEDLYHLVDSDGKYVLRTGNLSRKKIGDSGFTYESGPKEVCTNAHDLHSARPNEILQKYNFDEKFYRYVEADLFKKCTLPGQKAGFYIANCSFRNGKFGYCKDNSTSTYNQIYLNARKWLDIGGFSFFPDGTIIIGNHEGSWEGSKGSVKFTEEQCSKDGYCYLASGDRYLQWNPYGSEKVKRTQQKIDDLKKNNGHNRHPKQYADLKAQLDKYRVEEEREWLFDPDGMETLSLGHESMKIPFKFEKAGSLTPQPCNPSDKTRPRHYKSGQN